MKLINGFIFITTVLFILSAVLVNMQRSPEKKLVGQWKEISWEYEKVDYGAGASRLRISEWQKNDSFIHEAEVWQFNSSGDLLLISEDQDTEQVTWNVKGRGNILELKHANGLEDYQIQEITEDSLVIHFSFDLQVKGIVKITFRRVEGTEYAEKV